MIGLDKIESYEEVLKYHSAINNLEIEGKPLWYSLTPPKFDFIQKDKRAGALLHLLINTL